MQMRNILLFSVLTAVFIVSVLIAIQEVDESQLANAPAQSNDISRTETEQLPLATDTVAEEQNELVFERADVDNTMAIEFHAYHQLEERKEVSELFIENSVQEDEGFILSVDEVTKGIEPQFRHMYSKMPQTRKTQYLEFMSSDPENSEGASLAERILKFIVEEEPELTINSVLCNKLMCEIRWVGEYYGPSIVLQKSPEFPEFNKIDNGLQNPKSMNLANQKGEGAFIAWVVIDDFCLSQESSGYK